MTTESGKRRPVQSNPPKPVDKRVKWAGERDRCQLCDKDISEASGRHFFDAPTIGDRRMGRCLPWLQDAEVLSDGPRIRFRRFQDWGMR